MALFNLSVLFRLFTGRLTEEELVQVVESEDVPHGEISGAAPLTSNGARP